MRGLASEAFNAFAAQITPVMATAVSTGIPQLDGLLVSTPVVAALYLWVKSVQKDKRDLTVSNTAWATKVVSLAEAQAESSALIRDRLKRIERALELRAQ